MKNNSIALNLKEDYQNKGKKFGLFILKNYQRSTEKEFANIWFFATNLDEADYDKLVELNNTAAEAGKKPRFLSDIDKLVKGFGR